MSDIIDIIISAVDQASDVFNSIADSATGMGESISDATVNAGNDFDVVANNVSGFSDAIASVDSSTLDELADSLGMDADRVQELIDVGANVGSIPFNDAAASAEELGSSVSDADSAVQGLGNDLDIINSSMLLQLGDQLSNVAGGAEDMAQDMNESAISVGQLATQAGIAEPQMISLINNISNATFPNDEAMMYVKSLDQIGVASENLGQSATDLDKINDAFGMGANTVNSLGQELSVLGVDMNDVSSAFNALAYANANTVGGMDNYYNFLRKYDAQFKELGFNVDQASVIIAGATQKFGGGRAALTGLSDALKESNGDTRALEEALGLEAGSIENATKLTGEYEGQLQQLADEEAEHKTLLDQMGAAWEDLSLAASSAFAPVLSVIGLVGQVGSFGMQVKGLQELVNLTKRMTEVEIIDSAVKSGKAAIMSVVTVATTLYASIVGVLTGEIGLVAAATAVWNAILAMNPIMLVVLALVALVAIIYEVGKAFGWWSNVQGMMSGIWDGINRIWQAFINHPDVQAIIGAISDAWNILVGAITGAWNAVMDFLGINTNGDFDVVAAIITGVGLAWEAIKAPIVAVIEIVRGVIDVFSQVASGQMDLYTAIMNIWNSLVTNFGPIVNAIAGLALNLSVMLLSYAIQAGTNFVNGIIRYVSKLPGQFLKYLTNVSKHVTTQGNRWVTTARNAANRLVTGVITYISRLPGRMLTQLNKVVSSITTAGAKWVHAGISYGQKLVSSTIKEISNLPGKVMDEFGKIPGRINSAVSSAVSAAANFGSNIKNAVLNALHIASPGIIQRKIRSEFWDTVDRIKETVRPAYEAGRSYGESILNGFRSIDLSKDNLLGVNGLNSSVDVTTGQEFNIVTGEYYEVDDNMEFTVKQEHEIVFDFRNVPEWIDTDKLVQLMREAIKDKTLIKELVSNPDFQALDSQMKDRILRKVKRSKGV